MKDKLKIQCVSHNSKYRVIIPDIGDNTSLIHRICEEIDFDILFQNIGIRFRDELLISDNNLVIGYSNEILTAETLSLISDQIKVKIGMVPIH